MTHVDDFIEDFLEHKYDPVKAREYYLRTRKLKGRKTIDRSGPVFEQGKGLVRSRPASAKAEQRIIEAEKKLQRARAAASKLPAGKRKAVLRKLVAAQKKLNKLRKSLVTTKVTVRTAKDFPKAFPKKSR